MSGCCFDYLIEDGVHSRYETFYMLLYFCEGVGFARVWRIGGAVRE